MWYSECICQRYDDHPPIHAVKNTAKYDRKCGQTLRQTGYRWSAKRASSALGCRQSKDRRRPSLLQGRAFRTSPRFVIPPSSRFCRVNPCADMLGFKLANPARESAATQKTRPIYLDMQVREGTLY